MFACLGFVVSSVCLSGVCDGTQYPSHLVFQHELHQLLIRTEIESVSEHIKPALTLHVQVIVLVRVVLCRDGGLDNLNWKLVIYTRFQFSVFFASAVFLLIFKNFNATLFICYLFNVKL